MSNRHWIHCVDCDEESPSERLNWGVKSLRKLIAAREAIAKLAALDDGWSIEVEVRRESAPLEPGWFVKHAGHELQLYCEYDKPCVCDR